MSDNNKRNGRFLKKPSRYVGAGISMAVAIGIYKMNLLQYLNMLNMYNWGRQFLKEKESEDKTAKNKESEDKTAKNKFQCCIYNLEEIVYNKAWDMYTSSRRYLPRNKPALLLNWKLVETVPEKPRFTQYNNKDNDAKRVIFQAVLQNKSAIYQEHLLKAEVTSFSICESDLTKGYSQGSNVGLCLHAPDEVVQEASVFSKGFSLNHINGNVEAIPISWEIKKHIMAPIHSDITESKSVIERRREFDFEAMIGFKGYVIGTFYDQNNLTPIASYDIPIETIINELPQEMISKENGKSYIKINGRVSFIYDIEQ